METVVLKYEKESKEKIKEVSTLINKGEIIAFPTDTVYGIGANAFLESAVLKIYEAKGRPADNPLNILIPDISMVKDLAVDIPPCFYKLAEKFWPGGLTMILKKNKNIPKIVTAGLDTVGIRIPNSKIAREILEYASCPVAAPSANISKNISATNAKFVYEDFCGKIPYIIDGGECKVGIESTVLDLTKDVPLILRPGNITLEMLKDVIPNVKYHDGILKKKTEDLIGGMKYKKYNKNTKICLLNGSLKDKENYLLSNLKDNEIAFIFNEQEKLKNKENVVTLGSYDDLDTIAKNMFSKLREAEDKNKEKIYIQSVKREELGLSIMDRIEKATDSKINIKNILFICMGNTCRSPMAEFILKAKNIEGLNVKSRGLSVCCATGMSENSEEILKKYNIPCKGFHSYQVSKEEIEEADVIYTMEDRLKDSLTSFFPQFKDKIKNLDDKDIKDPYMQDLKAYEETFLQIKNAIDKIF